MLIFSFRSISQGQAVHLCNQVLVGEESGLLGEPIHEGELAGARPAVVQLHLVRQTPRLCAGLKENKIREALVARIG